jgi:hypothetical protein
VRDPWNDSELAQRFRAQARTAFARAPLNSALCDIIARDPRLFGLLGHAPTSQQLPVLLLASVHYLLIDEPDHPLAAWYPNLAATPRPPDDPELQTTLVQFVDERAPTVLDLVSSRRVQTNEVGRCALFLPAFRLAADDRVTQPLGHLDVGSSAGLTLLTTSYAYRYDDHPALGASPVELVCGTRGDSPVDFSVLEFPDISVRCGIDSRPIDISDPVEARWLEACCWPDQADRFHRLRHAIELARRSPPELLAGDAVDALEPAIERVSARAHPVVTTSWALSYLSPERRLQFVDTMDEVGRRSDLSWVIAESPAHTPELPHPTDLVGDEITALTLVTWRDGERTVHNLATCHPHGYWIHWRPTATQ